MVTGVAWLVELVVLMVVTGAATAAVAVAAMRRMVGVCIFVLVMCDWVWGLEFGFGLGRCLKLVWEGSLQFACGLGVR